MNYLNTAPSITFDNTKYQLAWSAHPTDVYYKQEYLPASQKPESFSEMLLLEVVTSSMTHKAAFEAKVEELKTMKRSNPLVSFDIFHHKESDEYLLDFVVTANSPDGTSINIAERNIYRYKKYTGPKGEQGVVLFGLSKRSYGNDVAGFVKGLTAVTKKDLLDKIAKFSFPGITIK